MTDANNVRATFEQLDSRGYEGIPLSGKDGYTAFMSKRFDNGARIIMKRVNGEYQPFSVRTHQGNIYANKSEGAQKLTTIPAVATLSDIEDFSQDTSAYLEDAEIRLMALEDLSGVPGSSTPQTRKVPSTPGIGVETLMGGELAF
jgi:hypothetical protein